MMLERRLRLLGAVAAAVLVAAPVLTSPALAQTPMDDPLDARDAKRVDRMEKVVRELRDIVFKAEKTGAPVVVQPADTDSRLADLASKITDLEQSLTRLWKEQGDKLCAQFGYDPKVLEYLDKVVEAGKGSA